MVAPVRRLITAAAVLAALAGPSTASAAPATRDATVRSFDGTPIATHFFPADGARRPTVLLGHGYGMRGATDRNAGSEELFGSVGVKPLVDAGFNVLSWDARGFGASGGRVMIDSKDFEGRDVQALISHVARQPEALLDGRGDPRIGMTGASYGGGIELVTAGIDHRVDAIAPIIAWNSLLTALNKDGSPKLGWGSLLTGVGVTARTDPRINRAFTEGATTGHFSNATLDFLRTRGPQDRLTLGIHVPTLITQGTADTLFTLREAMSNHALLKGRVPLKMQWFCGGHGVCQTSKGPKGHVERNVLTWFARYLKRRRSVDTGPPFEWLGDDGAWRSAQRFPLPTVSALRGSGAGTLPVGPGTTGGGGLLFATPSASAVNVGIGAPSRTVDVVGEPRLRLRYRGTALPAGTHLFAQIVDGNRGVVAGGQATPLPVTLDGRERVLERRLEPLALRASSGSRYRLQIVSGTNVYNFQRSTGSVRVSDASVSLPVVDARSRAVLIVGRPYDLRKAARFRRGRVGVRNLGERFVSARARLYHLRRRRGHRRRVWKEVGRSSIFRPSLGRRTIRLRVGRRLPRGQYQVRVGANDPYGRRVVVRGKRSRLRR
jgi:ABC-2 type transport system ATP-binding protein